MKLEPNHEEKANARHFILTKVPESNPQAFAHLIDTLLELEPNHEERAKVHHFILAVLHNTNRKRLYNLARLLRQLYPVPDWLAALGIESA